jgi:hypothetical protein
MMMMRSSLVSWPGEFFEKDVQVNRSGFARPDRPHGDVVVKLDVEDLKSNQDLSDLRS